MDDFLFGNKEMAMTALNKTDMTTPPILAGQWMNDADQAFQYLSKHELEKTSWWRSMSMGLTLLKQAQNIIASSKKHIEVQDERIKELEKLVTTDTLTGILNRRGFDDAYKRELDRVKRGLSIGGLVMMIDLDNFKAINDLHGHDAGDQALKIVAQSLHDAVRTMDIVARLGGDEFVVLMVNTDRRKVLGRIQDIIKQLNTLSFEHNGQMIPVRASIGLKAFDAKTDLNSILNDADENMYKNKQQGKRTPIKQDNKKIH